MTTALSCGQTILISPPSTFTSRYKDVNLRRLTKPNRVACKFNLKSLPTFSTNRPPNQVLPILPRGLSGLDLSAASSTLLSGNEAQKTSILLGQHKSSTLMSDVGFYIQPFAEHYQLFGDLIYFVPGAIKRLPQWFTMAYFMVAYFGVCIRRALAGKYVKLPFFSIPALAHTLFTVEGRYKPF
ncbi:hypothetical protein M0R45_035589 [Rubus argutus]|uniref:Protein TIC 20 n=1 Tax=Rubus argutus TaxID=59490 RepID=A0AAW1VTL1_RUBAR